jgi:hypothetical protein
MNAYKQYVTINESKQLLLSDLPFNPGQKVEVIVLADEQEFIATENQDQQIFEEANQAFLRLKNNPNSWKEELEERQLWEQTLLDGIDD